MDTKRVENKKLGIAFTLPEILQGELEQFEAEIEPYVNDAQRGTKLNSLYGAIVRAAAKVGWLNEAGITPESVSTMKPNAVLFIGENIFAHVGEAREVPPS